MRGAIANALFAVIHAAAGVFSVLFAIGHLSWREFELLGSVATFIGFVSFAASENVELEQFILRYARTFVAGSCGIVTVLLIGGRLVAKTDQPNIVLGFVMAATFSALSTYYATRAAASLKRGP